MRRLALVALLLPLAACGSLPQPFYGQPGLTGARLSRPPPARLVVQPPQTSMLSNGAATLFADDVRRALLAEAVPAVAGPARGGDWQLLLTASLEGESVVPSYVVHDPAGKLRGTAIGIHVPAAAWAAGDPAVLSRAADAAAPQIARMMTGVEAAIMQSDPHSLKNRKARIDFTGVTGAPGDGDIALAAQLRRQLPDTDDELVGGARTADYRVHGDVTVAPGKPGEQQVDIAWTVLTPDGKEAGRVSQLNDIKAGSLDHYWGATASAVAEQAAPGIREVITNQSGRANAPFGTASGPVAGGAGGGRPLLVPPAALAASPALPPPPRARPAS